MACVDDEHAGAHTHLDDDMAAETEEERLHARLSNGRWRLEHHYIPFPRTEWRPIGCTKTHVFAVIKNENNEYTPITMYLAHGAMMLPSHCVDGTKTFTSPWRKYAESFFGYLGGCAHDDRMCLVLENSVIVINAVWKALMRDNHIALRTLVSTAMNSRYLVVVGVEAGRASQSMFIYDLKASPPRRIYYSDAIKAPIRTVFLLNNIEQALLVQTEGGPTQRFVIASDTYSKRTILKNIGDISTLVSTDRPLAAKELAESSRIVQLIGNSFVLVKSHEDVSRVRLNDRMAVDVADYAEGVVVCHDSENSLHFFTSQLRHIVTVPWETCAAAALYYEDGVASILKPYPSLGRCIDAPDTVALLASFGALVTIKML